MTGPDLTRWRELLHFNKGEASKELGCDRDAYSRWEAGLSKIPRYVALACAAIAHGLPEWGAVKRTVVRDKKGRIVDVLDQK